MAASALPNVAVIVYDWKTFTLQELVQSIKKAIGTGKVTSVAVIAPGNKPGWIGEEEVKAYSGSRLHTVFKNLDN